MCVIKAYKVLPNYSIAWFVLGGGNFSNTATKLEHMHKLYVELNADLCYFDAVCCA